uniref:Sugar transferase n=1 Tax=Cyanothece sp. (strain PCC 7425 / ATCC 29141) TaxID=395961 RepID=B8HT97_CYAP4
MSSSLSLPSHLHQVPLPQSLPPLLIVAFTRPDLLQDVLEAIRDQTLLPEKILAFVDGARTPADTPLIQQCVSLLKNFSTFVPVEITTRPQNLGYRNAVQALTEVLSTHPAVVLLEDDTVPNPYFYDRMCRLLEAYRPHSHIFSVSAYANFPSGIDQQIDADFMISRRIFSWGFATWADRWHSIALAKCPQGFNPFGCCWQIPATLQTQYTIVNQFFLEKNKQADWVITMTLATLHQGYVHLTPMMSLTKNIGFGHPRAKHYKKPGPEPTWVNAHFDVSACPDRLPDSLELLDLLRVPLTGSALIKHLSKQPEVWLTPTDIWHLLRRYPDWHSTLSILQLGFSRLPQMLKRWNHSRCS